MILALTIFLLDKNLEQQPQKDKEPSLFTGIILLICLFSALMTDIAIIQLLNRL